MGLGAIPVTVVVACLFAGVGAWGAEVTVSPNHTYASELFGEGHAAISYPDKMTPMVTLTLPQDYARVAAGAGDTDPNNDRDACDRDHSAAKSRSRCSLVPCSTPTSLADVEAECQQRDSGCARAGGCCHY